jgi:predicted nucleotidyltransferase
MELHRLQDLVSCWAAGLPCRTRIYLYGSRFEGTHRPDSDLDLALEFLEPWVNPTLTWFDKSEQWQRELSIALDIKVHLELYDDENGNVRAFIEKGSVIIYESPAEPENDEQYSSLGLGELLSNVSSDEEEE